MPSPYPCLEAADVESFVRTRCFSPAEDGRIGVELERVLVPAETLPGLDAPAVDHQAVAAAVGDLGPLPGGSRVTFEPGGQVEVSSPPCEGGAAACAAAAGDMAVLDPAVHHLGLDLVGIGLAPQDQVEPVVDHPRYRAMAAYFDGHGSCGRTMMCASASLQVNVDIGDEGSQAGRWRLAHRLGPVLLATFANSPLSDGVPNGLRSGRSLLWSGIDATRTAPARREARDDEDPARAWSRYALDAHVMLVRLSDHHMVPLTRPLSFARWIDDGHELGFPTLEDLEYHLSTLFPPVRARGWLELRMIDSLPDPWWQVAVALCSALFDDGDAAERADQACGPVAGLWLEAARHGLSHPALARSAQACFTAALDALPGMGAGELVPAVEEFASRFVERGRCPGDEVLDQARRSELRAPAAAAGRW